MLRRIRKRVIMLRKMRWRMVMLIEDGDVEEEDPSQDRDPHFVQACAVEIHLDISEQQFYARICRKNAAPQS